MQTMVIVTTSLNKSGKKALRRYLSCCKASSHQIAVKLMNMHRHKELIRYALKLSDALWIMLNLGCATNSEGWHIFWVHKLAAYQMRWLQGLHHDSISDHIILNGLFNRSLNLRSARALHPQLYWHSRQVLMRDDTWSWLFNRASPSTAGPN